MNEQPNPNPATPALPEQQQPSANEKKSRKPMIWVLALAGFLLIAGGAAYLLQNRIGSGNTSQIRSVTYYYRDGQTVLWQGSRLAEENSPTFVHAVADELIEKYGESAMSKAGEWKITTTLDKKLQDSAGQMLEAQREQMQRQRADDAAIIAQDVATGQIVSWVGGLEDKVFYNGEDRLTSRSDVGSLVMPMVYAAYLENNSGSSADTTFEDTRRPLTGYPCTSDLSCLKNYDRTYMGTITMREALAKYRTVPAVEAMTSMIPNDNSPNKVDSINKTIGVIEKLMGNDRGYVCFEAGTDVATQPAETEGSQCYAASAMGEAAYAAPRDVVSAFGTLANDGKYQAQTGVLKIEHDGELIYEWIASEEQAVSNTTASIINDIMSDKQASVMAGSSRIDDIGSAKVHTVTGVTLDAQVYSSVQYTQQYVVGFWVFADADVMVGFGQTLTLPATRGWLLSVYENAQ